MYIEGERERERERERENVRFVVWFVVSSPIEPTRLQPNSLREPPPNSPRSPPDRALADVAVPAVLLAEVHVLRHPVVVVSDRFGDAFVFLSFIVVFIYVSFQFSLFRLFLFGSIWRCVKHYSVMCIGFGLHASGLAMHRAVLRWLPATDFQRTRELCIRGSRRPFSVNLSAVRRVGNSFTLERVRKGSIRPMIQ